MEFWYFGNECFSLNRILLFWRSVFFIATPFKDIHTCQNPMYNCRVKVIGVERWKISHIKKGMFRLLQIFLQMLPFQNGIGFREAYYWSKKCDNLDNSRTGRLIQVENILTA